MEFDVVSTSRIMKLEDKKHVFKLKTHVVDVKRDHLKDARV